MESLVKLLLRYFADLDAVFLPELSERIKSGINRLFARGTENVEALDLRVMPTRLGDWPHIRRRPT